MKISKGSILKTVRATMPARAITLGEAYLLAERQANDLLKLLGITHVPVDIARFADLPRIELRAVGPADIPKLIRSLTGQIYHEHELSGFSHHGKDGTWLIVVNKHDTPGRRRFTLAHEIKHVLDGSIASVAYATLGYGDEKLGKKQVEQICDHFAACLLMPRSAVKHAWASGIQDLEALAGHFTVSIAAMRVRLNYLGLDKEDDRPARSYFRAIAPSITNPDETAELLPCIAS
jgi:hypothetical protein